MTTNEQITVSESVLLILSPSIYQTNLGITEGSLYKLLFDSTLTDGVLKVYQGTQLIYSSELVSLGGVKKVYDNVTVGERVTMGLNTTWTDIISDEVTVTENIELNIE